MASVQQVNSIVLRYANRKVLTRYRATSTRVCEESCVRTAFDYRDNVDSRHRLHRNAQTCANDGGTRTIRSIEYNFCSGQITVVLSRMLARGIFMTQ